jgi:DNA polymerase-3 subunit gamma/tau
MAEIEKLALKYRPKKLSEVIGQPVVVKAFENAFKSKSLHNAYILNGGAGTGKTSLSRIIAAMENCEEGWGKDPCGKCSNCIEILSGNSMEVIEKDVASQGGIDDIRALHKSLYQNPVKCRVKYVILDEAHRLSGPAAEASLKMIEEPPAHVKFILATTEAQAFKDTIHSRCITWNFYSVSWTELFNHLKNIAAKENIEYEDKALQIAARFAKGSVRNSLQNLQTIFNYTGGAKLTAQAAIESIGVIDDVLYFDFMENIIQGNSLKCFQIVNKIFSSGKSAKLVLDGMFNHLNNLMIARACPNDMDSFNLGEEEKIKYLAQTKIITGETLLQIMNLLHQVSFGLSYSLDPDKLFNKFAIEALMCYKSNKK